MDLVVTLVDVWAAQVPDKPGGLAILLDALQAVGANLQSIIARREPDHPGKAVVYVTPLRGDRQIAAAAQVGFNVTHTLYSVQVLGPNRPGIAAEITEKVADAGINLRGFSASAIGERFAAYLAVDSLEDANRVMSVMEIYDASHA
jgi:hypothetical protein